MKKFLLAICFLFVTVETFGQQFSQYNTGTLYDSFENPAQAAFLPDTSYKYAFNFFIPNFNSNIYLTGNGQVPIKNRAFTGRYTNTNLTLGDARFSRANADANIYTIMFRLFKSLNGNQEIGISTQSRAEGRGIFTDETLLLLDGAKNFQDLVPYDNVLNDNYTFQSYHQVSFNYREQVTKKFSMGIKLSALFGIQYQQLQVNQSHLVFDKANDAADITLQGRYRMNYIPGGFTTHDLIPNPRNPGASISIGTALHTRDNFNIQLNVKDVGFIHWNKRSIISDFNTTRTAPNLSSNRREDNLYAATYIILRSADVLHSFVTPTNGKIELSANKSFWFDYEQRYKYSPTLIVQKELFFDGYTAALVNPFQYNNLVGTITTSYNNYGIFNTGLQFMVKSHNAEFYIGTDRLMQSVSFAGAATHSNAQINKNSSYSGADFFLGFSLKFGPLIKHPLNSSYIPLGDRPGLFKRLWNNIFHPAKDDGS
jgi:hypothetical protein